MRYLEPIQRGLRPWQAALQKISEIIDWLRQSRLIAGCGVTLIETGDGIVINAVAEATGSGSYSADMPAALARIRSSINNGYLADLHENGLDKPPTQQDVYVFLPEASYGAEIAEGTVVLVNCSYTKKYDVNVERIGS